MTRRFAPERKAYFLANASNIRQVEVAINLAWGANANKRQVRIPDRLHRVLHGAQPAGPNAGRKDLANLGLDDRGLASVYQVDFCSGPIHPDDFMPLLCEASRGHRTDVP